MRPGYGQYPEFAEIELLHGPQEIVLVLVLVLELSAWSGPKRFVLGTRD